MENCRPDVKSMVIIVGCNHGIQGETKDWNWGLDADQIQKALNQRSMFGRMLEELIQESQAGLIAEEWGRSERTIARRIAQRKRIWWGNINTTDEEKQALGIPAYYTIGNHSKQQVADWHRLRESVMFRKAKQLKNSRRLVLVICGFEHVCGLRKLFRRARKEVQVKDYRRLPWYDADAFYNEN